MRQIQALEMERFLEHSLRRRNELWTQLEDLQSIRIIQECSALENIKAVRDRLEANRDRLKKCIGHDFKITYM